MWTPVLVGTGITLAAIPLYWVLTDTFGIEGVAVASVLALGTYTAILALLWYSGPAGRARLRDVLGIAGRAIPPTVIGAAGAFVVSWGITSIVPGPTTLVNLLAVAAGTAIFAAIAFALGSFLYDLLTAAARRRPAPPDTETDVMEML
jgi:peptidoglycan biosynthesis protein MviN/MurJ (putative lipid II flippase)